MIAVAFDIETEGHQTNKGYPSLLLLLLRAAGSTYDVTLYKKDFGLTALVRTPLWRGGKKNASTGGRVACRLIEEKRSGLKQNTLLIEGFKPGASPCLFIKKDN